MLDPEVLTIGFARRAATYKRATLLLRDTNHLKRISAESGRLQILYAGKAHPADAHGRVKRMSSKRREAVGLR